MKQTRTLLIGEPDDPYEWSDCLLASWVGTTDDLLQAARKVDETFFPENRYGLLSAMAIGLLFLVSKEERTHLMNEGFPEIGFVRAPHRNDERAVHSEEDLFQFCVNKVDADIDFEFVSHPEVHLPEVLAADRAKRSR
jgi:hypothetical protein